jgi:hypothetical protein
MINVFLTENILVGRGKNDALNPSYNVIWQTYSAFRKLSLGITVKNDQVMMEFIANFRRAIGHTLP